MLSEILEYLKLSPWRVSNSVYWAKEYTVLNIKINKYINESNAIGIRPTIFGLTVANSWAQNMGSNTDT